MEISKSDIVQSIAGHDKGSLFYVIETDGVYLLLANGRERTVEQPKRKKQKHVCKVPRPDSTLTGKIRNGERVLNSELRRGLAILGQEISVSTKEVIETWQKTT